MVFSSPSWVPPIRRDIPDSVPAGQFAIEGNDDVARQAVENGKALFIDGISGNSYSRDALRQRVEWLASALAKELGWSPNEGSPWDKVVAIYSFNTIEYFMLCWAIHRLNGICLLIHPTSSLVEITSHVKKAKCGTIFTGHPLVSSCIQAAAQLSIPLDRIYTLTMPEAFVGVPEPTDHEFKSVDEMITEGSQLQPLEPSIWKSGQGREQIAYLCATSGTSGKQKLAMIPHYNLIVNVIQFATFENFSKAGRAEVGTGVVPFSHGYGLYLGHLAAWRGDTLVVFPRFDMQLMLKSIPQYRIQRLYLVPPILVALVTNPFLFQLFDMSSVESVVTGAAALDRTVSEKLHGLQPTWKILTAYGLTESVIVASFTSGHDTWAGSSGSLVPLFQARLVGPEGQEIEALNSPGEVLLKSPSIFPGYLADEEASKSAFDAAGWLRTGDVGMMKMGPNGTEHLFIVDRIKDMIKVKGLQVLPADIESVLLVHPAVTDAAVIGVPDQLAGERAQAYVVRSASAMAETSEEELRENIDEHVQDHLDETHWLHDRIFFVTALPKSQNGKVLKRELKAMAAAAN